MEVVGRGRGNTMQKVRHVRHVRHAAPVELAVIVARIIERACAAAPPSHRHPEQFHDDKSARDPPDVGHRARVAGIRCKPGPDAA